MQKKARTTVKLDINFVSSITLHVHRVGFDSDKDTVKVSGVNIGFRF